MVKNLPAMWETWVQSPGWEDPLEKGKATYSIMDCIVHGVTKSQTQLSDFHFNLTYKNIVICTNNPCEDYYLF